MNEFSTTQNADGYCAVCQQSNIFYYGQNAQQCRADITGSVNGAPTPMLPPGQMCYLPNTRSGTSNALELLISGQRRQLCEDITEIGPVTRPEDLRVAVGTTPEQPFRPPFTSPGFVADASGQPIAATRLAPLMPVGQVSSARMPYQRGTVRAGDERNALDVLSDTAHVNSGGDMDLPVDTGPQRLTAIEAHPSLGPPPFRDARDISDLSEAEEEWLMRAALAVIGPIEWVDQVTGATALGQSHGVDMSLTGTNLPGAVIETVEILLSGNRRRFLIEMFGQRISKVWVNSNGTVLISFTGNKLLRRFVTGNVYGAANARISLIETAARTRVNPGAAVRAVGSKAGVLSLGFVTFFNVAEWLAQPESERDVNELIATVSWDLAAVSVSIIVGALASAALLVLAAPIATAAVLVGVGIAAGVVAGLALDWVESRLGIKNAIRGALDDATVDELSPTLYQDMMTAP